MDKTILIPLGVWAILFGLSSVTNFEMVWMKTILGLAALALGTICLFRAFR